MYYFNRCNEPGLRRQFSALVLTLLFPVAGLAGDLLLAHKDPATIDVTIDGRLNEAVWQDQDIKPVTDFLVIDPGTLDAPAYRTEVRLFYTRHGLYAGVWCHQPAETLVRRLSSRDDRFNRDQVSITLDPSGAGLYGNWFAINLGNTLGDGLVYPEREFTNEWDGPWHGASSETDFGWTAEYFLPWSMLAMPKSSGDSRRLGFYISRKVAHLDERWSFPALPPTKPKFMSGLQGLTLESVNPRRQFSFQPFASAGYDELDNDYRIRGGADFFWRPTLNLQLSASLAPDFGTVEIDDLVVNLGAFETFFGERRPFFTEGQGIFVTSPRKDRRNNRLILVNTRRIGSPVSAADDLPDDLEENVRDLLEPVDLYGALKVTGQTGNLRYGLLAAFEEDSRIDVTSPSDPGLNTRRNADGQNFGALRLLHEVRSPSAGYRALGWITTVVDGQDKEAYVQGVDAHYLSVDGRWKLDAQGLYSRVDGESGAGAVLDLVYVPKQGFKHSLFLDWFDKDLEINDLGYIRRNNRFGTTYIFDYENPNWKAWGQVVRNWNNDGRLVRSGFFAGARRRFDNLYFLQLSGGYFPERWEDVESLGNGDYRLKSRGQATLELESNSSKRWIYRLSYNLIGEGLGDWSHRGDARLIARLSDRFFLQADLRYQERNDWLIHTSGRQFTTYNATGVRPRLKSTLLFSARSELGMEMQWVGIDATEHNYYQVPVSDGDLLQVAKTGTPGARDFTISDFIWQIRYRWEFAPLSELTVVYSRSAGLESRPGHSFDRLFSDALDEPLLNRLLVRVRFRFGD